MAPKHHAYAALAILTALNFFNYLDRSVLFAVQPLIQKEFPGSDAQYGLLTSAFFICYMVAAFPVGVLADRYARKQIMIAGAIVWSAATLLTAVTHDFTTLLIRHAIVGIGEATFVTVAPSFLADYFPEQMRGRIFGLFYMNILVGTAAGYAVGGVLGNHYTWRAPFYVGAAPGFVLALLMFLVREPQRGAADHLPETQQRATLIGLFSNAAFWTATLGMAMVTFCLGGLQVWMPTFLSRLRQIPLDRANLMFGGITAAMGILGTLIGGWMGDRLLRRTAGAYYFVSAATLLIAVPAMFAAIYGRGRWMFPAISVAEFLLFLNTAPLNAAVVNSVGAHIRATAMAVNLFVIHLLGDVPSPPLIGRISDHTSLQTGFLAPIAAIVVGTLVLFLGMKYAPSFATDAKAGATA